MPALSDVTVVCVGQFYFAPYCSMILARMGADVIKVEALRGDPYRKSSRTPDDISVQFGMINSGKRSIAVDLRSEEGQEVVRRLAARADVLIQNLAPGAMERFGLGYDVLEKVNPRLVMASGTGFGSFGPYAGLPAMDLTIQARTAVMSTTGFPENPPVRTGPSIVDFMAGVHLATGVLAALFQREHTGRGQHVEVSLQDAILPSLSSNIAGLVSSGGTMPERTGNQHGGMAVVPYNAYPTQDGWVTLLCPTQAHWERLGAVMADPATADPRFATMKDRCDNSEAVDEIVGRWTRTFTKQQVVDLVADHGIPAAPVLTLGELLNDEHVKARGVLRWEKDDDGEWLTLGSPIFMSDSPMVEPARTRPLGADTDDILGSVLGMSTDEISALRDRKAIA